MSKPLSQRGWFVILLLIGAALAWGSGFILTKWAIAEIDVYYFLFLRFLIASFALALLNPGKLFRVRLETITSAMFLGIFLALTFITQTEGIRITTASNNALITGLYMIFIPIMTTLFFKMRPRPASIIGAVVSFAGLYFLTHYSLTGMNLGDLLTLLCAVTAALHIIFTGKMARHHSARQLMIFQCLFISLLCGGIALLKGEVTTSIPNIAWVSIIITALGATAYAFSIQIVAQRVIDPTRAGIICSLETVFGTLFAWLWGGEMLTALSLFGGAMMVTGMLIAELSSQSQKVMTLFKRYSAASLLFFSLFLIPAYSFAQPPCRDGVKRLEEFTRCLQAPTNLTMHMDQSDRAVLAAMQQGPIVPPQVIPATPLYTPSLLPIIPYYGVASYLGISYINTAVGWSVYYSIPTSN